MLIRKPTLLLLLALIIGTVAAAAQTIPPALYDHLSWRFIGPFRGGRTDAVAGVPGNLAVAYVGTVDGGIFKTTDAGATWQPLFQHEPVASIGALAVAPSAPKIIYAGTGENTIRSDASYGDGIYRSDDGGKTWRHIGLTGTRHIGRILVDPSDPNRVLVAALGHAWGPNPERGVFLTTDGGRSWTKTLYRNDHTGAIDLARDPAHPQSIYAATWDMRRPPWYQYGPLHGPDSAIYHSADGGQTWQKLALRGLPANMGRIGLAVGDAASGPRVFAIVSVGGFRGKGNGLYASRDGGASWTLVNGAGRISGRGWYFGRVSVVPNDPDVVYLPNTSLYRSTDGGAHFTAIKGSPDGDDFQRLWIDPTLPTHLITTADQGASLSLNHGRTWSSWFNQPSAQIYHIATDDQVPYNIYGTQQDSGALMIPSRGRSGIITNHDWQPIGCGESGYAFPKQGDPNIIYCSSSGGQILRFNLHANTLADISPVKKAGFAPNPSTAPVYGPWNTALAPSPFNPDALYAGTRKVFATTDAGNTWRAISPVLTSWQKGRACTGAPTLATAAQCGYSVVYALGVSPVQPGVIWAGTDDTHLWLTQDDGAHWTNVTPPGLGPWSRFDTIAADPHHAETAYVAVDRHEVDDLAPYIYITTDAGQHWRKAVTGIPAGDYVRVVRPDPKRAGLLYAGTERGVFVSFNDGRSWQSLSLNLPPASVRDLRVHAGDLIIATHGRGIWILDDASVIRQATPAIAASAAHLYAPHPAIEYGVGSFPVWLGLYEAEARPPEVPHATNPPMGAILDYWLGSSIQGPVTLSIYDSTGSLVRRYSSADQPAPMPPANFPDYFKSPPTVLSAAPGAHRFVWDFRKTPPPGRKRWEGNLAILHRTPRGPLGTLVAPGRYRVVLRTNGKDYTQTLTVRPSPYATPPTR